MLRGVEKPRAHKIAIRVEKSHVSANRLRNLVAMMTQPSEQREIEGVARVAASKIRSVSGVDQHDFGIVLGSGWASAVHHIEGEVVSFPAREIPGFRKASVEGHTGTIVSITLPTGKRVLFVGARSHLYEGYGIHDVAHPVRTIAACGAKTLILTNGAGGIKNSWKAGQPVLISDHINLTAVSPLEGASFLDLTDLYSQRLRDIAKKVEPNLDEGVYVQFRGPNYETPAEVQMAKAMGGHIVGMSTALEAIAAREAGMEVLGLSLITNLAAGISPHPLSHQEVISSGRTAEPIISKLLSDIVQAL